MKLVASALIACVASLSPILASAQTGNALLAFTTRLDQSRTVLQVDPDGLHGPGAAVLANAVAQARYVLIGEDHLSREIPQFTNDICRLMAPTGLDAFAVEIGPEAAGVVNASLRRPDRVARIAAFAQIHPDAFAFQNGRDESDMAAECARLAGPGFRMWGLDKEFFGAAGYLIERMLAAQPGPIARSAIEKLAEADRLATTKAFASGSPGDLTIYSATDPQLAEVGAAIADDGGNRVKELFDALMQTRAIYLGQNTDGFASNGKRAQLMKRTLVKYLDAAAKPERVLFKFGDVHMAKGLNALGQRDLGNFVAERADGEGVASLHIAVYGAKGVHALYAGVGRQVRHEPFVMADDPDYSWLKEALGGDARRDARDWTLIDLRPLRIRPSSDMGGAWRRVAEGYDLIVIAPELTPSTLIGAR